MCVCVCMWVCNYMDSQHPLISPLNSSLMKVSLQASYSITANHIFSGNFSKYTRTLPWLHLQIDKCNSYWVFYKSDNILFVWADRTSLFVHSLCLVFRKIQFPLPSSTLPSERNVKLYCQLHTLKNTYVISVVTPGVTVWYSGTAVRAAA
jgi:hypothetical protein